MGYVWRAYITYRHVAELLSLVSFLEINKYSLLTEKLLLDSIFLFSVFEIIHMHYYMGPLSPLHGCGWRRRPPDMEGSCQYIGINTMFSGSLVTITWRVLRLWMEETASRYGG
jgi:hypothetical protein